MEHLNKLCALAHIQEIIDIIKTPIKKINDESVMEEIVKDESMHKCADLALVTNQQHEGQCGFVLEDLEYELTRIATKIADARHRRRRATDNARTPQRVRVAVTDRYVTPGETAALLSLMRHPLGDTVTSPYKRRVERIHLTHQG